MSLALAPKSADIVITADQLALVKSTIAVGATDAELKLFLFDCTRQGVHPLDRLIHFTVRKDKSGARKYTPVTSIDFMRIRAADSGEMAGSDDPTFDGTAGPTGVGTYFSATVTVYRLTQGQRFAYTATARWSEYKPEANDFMWRKMPHTMLGKCAEALALRKGFPRQLAGLYAKEEMEQGDSQAPPVVSPGSMAGVSRPAVHAAERGEPGASTPPAETVDTTTGEVTHSTIAATPHTTTTGWTSVTDSDQAVDAPASTERGGPFHWIVRCKSGTGRVVGEVTFSDGTTATVWAEKATLYTECLAHMHAAHRVTFTVKADKYQTLKDVSLYVDLADAPF